MIRAVGAIDFSALCDVFQEPTGEGMLICELVHLLDYLVPQMVSE